MSMQKIRRDTGIKKHLNLEYECDFQREIIASELWKINLIVAK